jgi:putative salt-induced outer membrane protein
MIGPMAAALALAASLAAPRAGPQAAAPDQPDQPADDGMPRLEAHAELSFVKTSGNTSTSTLGLSGDATLRPGAWVVEFRTSMMRSRAEGVLNAASTTAVSRLSHPIWRGLSAFGQHDYLHDPFAGLGDRHQVTGGLEFAVLETDRHVLKIDAGFGFTNQSSSGRRLAGGMTNVSYRWIISDTTEITHDTSWKFAFARPDARRLESTTAVTVGLTSILSLRVSHELRHQASPRPTFRQTDATMSTALVVNIQR